MGGKRGLKSAYKVSFSHGNDLGSHSISGTLSLLPTTTQSDSSTGQPTWIADLGIVLKRSKLLILCFLLYSYCPENATRLFLLGTKMIWWLSLLLTFLRAVLIYPLSPVPIYPSITYLPKQAEVLGMSQLSGDFMMQFATILSLSRFYQWSIQLLLVSWVLESLELSLWNKLHLKCGTTTWVS